MIGVLSLAEDSAVWEPLQRQRCNGKRTESVNPVDQVA